MKTIKYTIRKHGSRWAIFVNREGRWKLLNTYPTEKAAETAAQVRWANGTLN